MKRIELSRGKYALVDDSDFGVVSRWKWSYSTVGYAFRNTPRPNKTVVYLHRFLTECPEGMEVDHINGDKLDNRRSNLRLCTRRQNSRNKRVARSKSGHLGVYWSNQNKKWNAQIGPNGKSISLGFFDDMQDAIKARKTAELKHFGEFAPSWRA